MADAYLIQLADAVRDQLADGSWSMPIAPIRAYRPRKTLRQIGDVMVIVAPSAVESTREGRGSNEYVYTIDVAVIQKLVEDETKAELQADALMNLVEEISDWALALRLTSPAARCTSVVNDPAFSSEHWDEQRTFITVLRIKLRAAR